MATTIGIIEDNPELLDHFSNIIQSDAEFLLAGSANNGADGISLINHSRADVYLVDLGLPDMEGTEVIKHAIEMQPDCDVMVLTVFGDDAHVIASIECGATGYILKDSASFEILDCIRTLRAGGSPLTPVIARRILQRFAHDIGGPVKYGSSFAPDRDSLSGSALTEREAQILQALAKGLSNKEIGDSCRISAHTVADHVKKIYRKLAVHSRGEAVYEATKLGLIKL